MLLGKTDDKRFVLGYDLGEKVSQISYLGSDADMPETLSVLAGAELYNIPTVLCKRKDVNQWYFGKEAVRHIDDGDAVPVYGLVSAARDGKPVAVGDAEYDPIALLTLFIKRSLSLLTMEFKLDKVEAIMFTTKSLDHRMVQVLNAVTAALELKTDKVFYQSHEESLFNYMLYQPQDLMQHVIIACDYDHEDLTLYEMTLNHNTTPIVATINVESDDGLKLGPDGFPKDAVMYHKTCERLDDAFLNIMQKMCNGKMVSTIFLLGDGFKEKWTNRSLEFLCRTRRVFQGNNLFSKGATIAARERIRPSECSEKYVYLGEDKLKANIGMNLLKCGNEAYQAILDAGVNWYEAKAQLDVYADPSGIIELQITPLTGKSPANVQFALEGLENRPKGTSRLHMIFTMNSVNEVNIRVQDMGFGELFPGTNKIWEETIEL
ncbi:DUF5716 family protein [Butyrivibrio sp. YAB3001]|uniref:DUF5716 family protein n=1 Tax=Butyrivibrio sp. YAB3001 TaxID=1520812 RepID=UPI0008F62E6A|nr:DUF5716 family protein [Butyrivibrio sp. YAB3001]SFC60333.1 hypothetical protein SAMN02910398_02659 [Butyrivibrio sp. YAB3001]